MTEQRRDIGRFIREQRKLAELSVRRLADMAGVSNPYLSQIERGLRKPSAEILQQLARALELSAETMYVQAGILDADHRPEPPSLESAIRSAPELTDDQRKALLGVYRSFLAANTATTEDDDGPAPGGGPGTVPTNGSGAAEAVDPPPPGAAGPAGDGGAGTR